MCTLGVILTTGKIIEYGLYGEPPAILGYDVVGVIEEVGPDVKNYKKGDRMYQTSLSSNT